MGNELHRVCWCGETPKLIGSPHDPKRRGMFVRCPDAFTLVSVKCNGYYKGGE